MKKIRSGSTVISAIIYIFATTFMVIVLMQNTSGLYPRLIGYRKETSSYLKLCTAFDLVARDFYSAPVESFQWNIANEHEINWNVDKKTVGWCFQKNRLVRSEGTFDVKRKRWRKKTKSLAADSLSECSFVLNKSGEKVIGLTLALSTTENGNVLRRERTVNLRSGVMYEICG